MICFALPWLRLNFYLFHYFTVVHVYLAAFASKACVQKQSRFQGTFVVPFIFDLNMNLIVRPKSFCAPPRDSSRGYINFSARYKSICPHF